MLPEAKSIKRLLYVSDQDGAVYVYDFDTGREVGTLNNVLDPDGQCVDARGDVWIAEDFGYAGYVTEYPHGGIHALRTLPTVVGPAMGCAVDPKNGNLAVVTAQWENANASVLIFNNTSFSYAAYSNQNCGYTGTPGYDDKGNLYFEAGAVTWRGICELRAGGSVLVTRTTNISGIGQSGVMWDGKYLTITVVPPYNPRLTAIYRVKIKSGTGKLVAIGKTLLHDSHCGGTSVAQPFIVGKHNTPENNKQGSIVVGGNAVCGYRFDFWRYPREGRLLGELVDAPRDPVGQSVSIKE